MTPEGRDLLEEAIVTLRAQLAPTLSGDARYLALLTANAIATALREETVGAALEADQGEQEALAEEIRAGGHDDDAALYDQLLAEAARRAWVADPSALSDEEYAEFVGEAAE